MTEPDWTEEIGDDDALAIGRKVMEMADRLKPIHKACPGVRATWAFEDEDTRYKVVVTIDPQQPKNQSP